MFYVNSHPITGDVLVAAILDYNKNTLYLLDTRDGGIVTVQVDDRKKQKQYSNSNFKPISALTSEVLHNSLYEYISAMSPFEEDTPIYLRTIKEAPDYSSALALFTDEDVLSGWEIWKEDVAWEFASDWIATIQGGEERWEFDCDCPLCQLAQDPSATLGDHLEAFGALKRKNKSDDFRNFF